MIENGKIEQVKGMTYRLNALLSDSNSASIFETESNHDCAMKNKDENSSQSSVQIEKDNIIKVDEEFANVNDISYTLLNIFSESYTTHIQIVEDVT